MESTPLAAARPRRLQKKGRWILLALVIGGGAALWNAAPWRATTPPLGGGRVERVVPESLRIRVEVLNAAGVRGLARQATFHLRDLGFDVVASGNATERLDSSLVLVRSGRLDWGELAAAALGAARVESRPDSLRYVDLTILLGTSWRPPPQTFHP